jgi:response regulator RpfG family c-di-GMP phosphodiesterase
MNATPIKVLVIDDEPAIRKLLRMGLSTQGYEILEASNGKIALEKLAEAPRDYPLISACRTFRATTAAHDPRPKRERADRGAVEPRR